MTWVVAPSSISTLPVTTLHASSEAFMAALRQTLRGYLHDRTFDYQVSKADLERLTDAFYRMDRSEYVWPRHQRAAEAECIAFADYSRAVNALLTEWRAVRLAFDREIQNRDDERVFQGLLDQLDTLLHQVELLTVPDIAAAVHRVFIAMLHSERAYFQDIFDDVGDIAIDQLAADFQAKAHVFRTEFDRLLRGLS